MTLRDLTEAGNVAWLTAKREYLAEHVTDQNEYFLRLVFTIGFAMGGKCGTERALGAAKSLIEGKLLGN